MILAAVALVVVAAGLTLPHVLQSRGDDLVAQGGSSPGAGSASPAADTPPGAAGNGTLSRPLDQAGSEPTTAAPASAPASSGAPAAPVITPPATDAGTPGALQTGSMAVVVDLPTGAVVRARDAAGRVWPLASTPTMLPVGAYTLEFVAPGFQPEQYAVTVQAGSVETWSPRVRPLAQAPAQPPPPAVQPPPPAVQSPVRNVRADQSAIEAEVRAYVAAFNSRDVDAVVPLLPASSRAGWETLLRGQDVTNFSASLGSIETPRVDADTATVSFVVDVAFRNNNQTQRPVLRLVGRAVRSPDGWRLVSLTSQ